MRLISTLEDGCEYGAKTGAGVEVIMKAGFIGEDTD